MMKTLFRTILPSRLKQSIYLAGCFLVRDIDKINISHPSMEWSFKNLKRLGFSPNSIIDVGAYQGKWTEMIKSIFPTARVLMIEAQRSKEEYLQKVKNRFNESVECSICLLGSSNDKNVFFNEMETGSSVFEEQSVVPRKTISMATNTLDTIAQKYGFTNPNFLKLDVQGYELEVLKGAANVLSQVEVVLMEVALIGINKGAPLINEVLNFMEENNFAPYDICSLIRRPLDYALWQTDIIFVKKTSALL